MTLRRILPVFLVIAACAAVAWVWLRPPASEPDRAQSAAPPPADRPAQDPPDGARVAPPDLTLVILPSCEDRLLVEPCCRIQGGGLLTAGPFVEETKEYTPTIGVFMGNGSLAPGPLGQAQLRLVHAFVLPYTPVQVVSAGEGELVHGVEYVRNSLTEMAKQSNKAILAANATDERGSPILRGFEIARYVAEPPDPQVPRNVLFVGVVAESVQRRLAERGSDVTFTDARAAAKATYESGLAQAKSVGYEIHDAVLLVQGTVDEAAAILEGGPPFDVAAASWGGVLPELEPREVGSTPVFYPGRGMRYAWRVLMSETAREPVRGFLSRLSESLAQQEHAYREILLEHMTKLGAIDLEQAVQANARPPHPDGDFVGAKACAECHAQEVAQHAGSAHARRLVYEGAVTPACVSCHTTGVFHASGWSGLEDTSDLIAVSCEACHGPASAHLAEPTAPYGEMRLDACRRCHLPDRSPAFDPEALWGEHGHALPRTR